MPTPDAVAAALVERHARPVPADDGIRLADYAESSRVGDWSLRSALVRFAQPEPLRASAVLELLRRTDGALHPHRRLLESTLVATDPALAPGPDGLAPAGPPRLDARAADLARVLARVPAGPEVVDAYAGLVDLDPTERAAADVLVVALVLDALADRLAAWADDRTDPPPTDPVDAASRRAFALLGELGVPRETRPERPPGRRRG